MNWSDRNAPTKRIIPGTGLTNWLQRIFRKKGVSPSDIVLKEGAQQAGQEFLPDAHDESPTELNQELQSGIYGSVDERNGD